MIIPVQQDGEIHTCRQMRKYRANISDEAKSVSGLEVRDQQKKARSNWGTKRSKEA